MAGNVFRPRGKPVPDNLSIQTPNVTAVRTSDLSDDGRANRGRDTMVRRFFNQLGGGGDSESDQHQEYGSGRFEGNEIVVDDIAEKFANRDPDHLLVLHPPFAVDTTDEEFEDAYNYIERRAFAKKQFESDPLVMFYTNVTGFVDSFLEQTLGIQRQPKAVPNASSLYQSLFGASTSTSSGIGGNKQQPQQFYQPIKYNQNVLGNVSQHPSPLIPSPPNPFNMQPPPSGSRTIGRGVNTPLRERLGIGTPGSSTPIFGRGRGRGSGVPQVPFSPTSEHFEMTAPKKARFDIGGGEQSDEEQESDEAFFVGREIGSVNRNLDEIRQDIQSKQTKKKVIQAEQEDEDEPTITTSTAVEPPVSRGKDLTELYKNPEYRNGIQDYLKKKRTAEAVAQINRPEITGEVTLLPRFSANTKFAYGMFRINFGGKFRQTPLINCCTDQEFSIFFAKFVAYYVLDTMINSANRTTLDAAPMRLLMMRKGLERVINTFTWDSRKKKFIQEQDIGNTSYDSNDLYGLNSPIKSDPISRTLKFIDF